MQCPSGCCCNNTLSLGCADPYDCKFKMGGECLIQVAKLQQAPIKPKPVVPLVGQTCISSMQCPSGCCCNNTLSLGCADPYDCKFKMGGECLIQVTKILVPPKPVSLPRVGQTCISSMQCPSGCCCNNTLSLGCADPYDCKFKMGGECLIQVAKLQQAPIKPKPVVPLVGQTCISSMQCPSGCCCNNTLSLGCADPYDCKFKMGGECLIQVTKILVPPKPVSLPRAGQTCISSMQCTSGCCCNNTLSLGCADPYDCKFKMGGECLIQL
eukprot:TRINITY_DN183_c0_g1_i2.p2 TRINITY_DN183_c0_g1~~TRINITY_DN183_c0_g1_i2.p2  ORF type:complete len:268 (+),score=35.78 TRINITY_DN183_c0_g1_i2:138-941(+)